MSKEAEKYLLSIGFDDSHLPELFNDDDKSYYTIPELLESYYQSQLKKDMPSDDEIHAEAERRYPTETHPLGTEESPYFNSNRRFIENVTWLKQHLISKKP